MKTEALRLALEALSPEPYRSEWAVEQDKCKAITAIKAALEAKDEAVAWMWMPTGEVTTDPDRADGMWEPLFLTPPQRTWVGLTEAECGVLWKVGMTPFDYYRAIESKLKEKNT